MTTSLSGENIKRNLENKKEILHILQSYIKIICQYITLWPGEGI